MNLEDKNGIPFFQVDAFTSEPFRGNPAAVCIMPCDLDDTLYQSIAQEMNLSETAFVERLDRPGEYRLRWFTPLREVPLCGHATLATAHVLFEHLGFEGEKVSFQTLSGVLKAERAREGIRMEFPRNDPFEVEAPEGILEGLDLSTWEEVQYSDTNQKLLVRVESEKKVRGLQPDFNALLAAKNSMGWRGVIVTAEGSERYDFISRYFAPWMGVNEDPVTGSAHTVLAPYWSKLSGTQRMRAYQASERGGELLLELTEERVLITGRATTVIEGFMKLRST
jgi:PhzF family phenazine biosynthesis protein